MRRPAVSRHDVNLPESELEPGTICGGWYYVPEPARGRAGPMTNDVDVDDRGLIYLVDRGPQFDILEFKRG